MPRYKHRIVIDAKDVNEVTKRTVDSVRRKYTFPFFPKQTIIAVPRRTKVTSSIRGYARRKKVRIDRLNY